MKLQPLYLRLYQNSEFKQRIKSVYLKLERCTLCPRKCGVNRLKNERGICKVGFFPVVSSFNVHFGEEPPISGSLGSGTIFFTHCNLRCVYCQNYPISQLGYGEEVSFEKLAEMMLDLQNKKCHNINFVTPTHVIGQILIALEIAIEKGLNIPLVYNSSGYDSVDTLRLLENIIDIYMPDTKYSNDNKAVKYSNAPDYWNINRKALLEMYRQVGELKLDINGVAQRGLLIRHLVLPENISESAKILNFIAHKISKNTYMSIMAQYHPAYKSYEYPELLHRITLREYKSVLEIADKLGLEQGWRQTL